MLPKSELLPLTTSHAPDMTQSTTRQASHESLFVYLEQALHPEYGADAQDGPAKHQEITLSQEESCYSSRSTKRSHSKASRSGGFCVMPSAKQLEVA